MDTMTIDWNAVWDERMRLHVEANAGQDAVGFWAGRETAEKYWRTATRDGPGRERIERTLRELPLSPSSRVLDVGAGPGVLAIPLARRVAHVTAVEPAPGMVEVLRRNLRDLGVRNLRCVENRWEAVDPREELDPPYDVVLCSMSLAMFRIRDALLKMEAASRGYVYLYWFAGQPTWDRHPVRLWPLLHGSDYHPLPKCDILFNVLYQMGVYPSIEAFSFQHRNRFATLDDAVGYLAPRYRAANDRQRSILRAYLAEVLEPEADGLVLRSEATCMKVWWRARKAPAG